MLADAAGPSDQAVSGPGITPSVPAQDVVPMTGGDGTYPLAELLAALIEQGKLVKVSDTVLFSSDAYQVMKQTVVAHLQKEGRITLAQVRDLFQTSRKYAQALLEHLDDQRVTRRVGDERVLR